MEFSDFLAPLAGEFDVSDALEEWRWLVPDEVSALVVTALGDLFLIKASDGSVLLLDTLAGQCSAVAASVEEWERLIREPETFESWFTPGFVMELREAHGPLAQGHCYSPLVTPALSGAFTTENFSPVHWRVHFSREGRTNFAIKDLPDGTKITKWNFTEI